jgi:predicted GNAT family acetyltransferase
MGQVRVLTRRDAPEIHYLLDLRPIDNVLISARIRKHGVEKAWLGNDLLGYFEHGRLVSFLSDGYSLHPINATPRALDGFSRRLEQRRCTSIVGVRDEAMGLWQRLCERSFTQWASPREVRDDQRVMAIHHQPTMSLDSRVEPIPSRYLDSYHAASVAMYTEEVGVAPIDPHGSYRDHVAGLMMQGATFGVIDQGRVIFKADVVAAAGTICQVGGVWLTPQLRGQGLSKPAIAAVVAHCRRRFTTVSLYVNSYNLPALRSYEAVGFTEVGQCATILY